MSQSLLALANCINALAAKGGRPRHVKYRDSKLTLLLKSSLEGRCKVVMIANLNPSHLTFEESHNTLKCAAFRCAAAAHPAWLTRHVPCRYADRAKAIRINPAANVTTVGLSRPQTAVAPPPPPPAPSTADAAADIALPLRRSKRRASIAGLPSARSASVAASVEAAQLADAASSAPAAQLVSGGARSRARRASTLAWVEPEMVGAVASPAVGEKDAHCDTEWQRPASNTGTEGSAFGLQLRVAALSREVGALKQRVRALEDENLALNREAKQARMDVAQRDCQVADLKAQLLEAKRAVEATAQPHPSPALAPPTRPAPAPEPATPACVVAQRLRDFTISEDMPAIPEEAPGHDTDSDTEPACPSPTPAATPPALARRVEQSQLPTPVRTCVASRTRSALSDVTNDLRDASQPEPQSASKRPRAESPDVAQENEQAHHPRKTRRMSGIPRPGRRASLPMASR